MVFRNHNNSNVYYDHIERLKWENSGFVYTRQSVQQNKGHAEKQFNCTAWPTCPDVNKLFNSPARKSDGHEKWGAWNSGTVNVFAASHGGNSRINTSVGASGTDAITTLIWLRMSTLPLVGTSVLSPPLTLKRSSSSIAWFSIYNKRRRLVAAPNSGHGSKSNTQTQRNILSKILIFFVFLSSVIW